LAALKGGYRVIAYLEGTLVSRGTEAVVAVGGGSLGLTLQLSARAAEQLPPVGDPVRLWTHLVTRDDGWFLYGFLSTDERTMFRLLISVSGIGPKLALGLLSGASPGELAGYLSRGDELSLAKLPGIGRKSAARLVVELGQRIPAEWVMSVSSLSVPGSTGVADPELEKGVAVLTAMGLTISQAEKAMLAAKAADDHLKGDLQQWVRAALRCL